MNVLTVVGYIAAILILFHVGVFAWFFVKAAKSGKLNIKPNADWSPYLEPEDMFFDPTFHSVPGNIYNLDN